MVHQIAEPTPTLSELLNQYERGLSCVVHEATVTEAQVLEVLLTRDSIQSNLKELPPNAADLQRLEALDTQLRGTKERIQSIQNLKRWRSLANPDNKIDASAWWWPSLPQSARGDWLWSAASVVFLSASASLILNTASRFWSGGFASAGTLAVVTQSVLTLIAGKGALTQSGRQGWETFLKQRHVPEHHWQRWSCMAAGSVFLVVGGVHRSLPQVATWYNEWGWSHYEDRQLGTALSDFQTALSLRPDYAAAQFNSGLVYEDLQQYEQAQESYQFVVASDPEEVPLEVWLSAHNNLARLHLLAGDDREAAPLLMVAMDRLDIDVVEKDPDIAAVNYNLLKNLGWVRLRQGRHREAQTQLEEAIAFEQEVLQVQASTDESLSDVALPNRAAAYCLLAQVADAQKRVADADIAWEQCLLNANLGNSDEDTWVGVYELRELADEKP
ncbi:MAG: tetratricopeptide repeat protein [Cyanobacteria bacterium P01_A01_bin.17]